MPHLRRRDWARRDRCGSFAHEDVALAAASAMPTAADAAGKAVGAAAADYMAMLRRLQTDDSVRHMLPIACRVAPVACCTVPVACYTVPVAFFLLRFSCMLHAARCMVSVACLPVNPAASVCGARGMLRVVLGVACGVLHMLCVAFRGIPQCARTCHVACCMRSVACCVSHAVRCMPNNAHSRSGRPTKARRKSRGRSPDPTVCVRQDAAELASAVTHANRFLEAQRMPGYADFHLVRSAECASMPPDRSVVHSSPHLRPLARACAHLQRAALSIHACRALPAAY